MKIAIKKHSEIKGFENFLLWYFAVMICVYNNCFLKWDSYNHTAISIVFKLLYHTVCVLMLVYVVFNRPQKKHLNIPELFCIMIAVLLYIHANFLGGEYFLLNVIPMLETIVVIFAICLMDDLKKTILLKRIIIVFGILVLPSMIYFILYSFGIDIPYSVLASDNPGKVIRRISYMHYPFGLIIKAPWSIARFTGVFDEPGFVGTMAAILISIGYRRCKTRWIILLFIEGMLSFSMAFYVLILIFAIFRAFVDGAFKAVGIVAIIVVALTVFVSIPFENENLKEVQSRIDLSSSFFVEDNRTSDTFDEAYDSFLSEGGYDLIMGKGGTGAYEKNTMMAGSNSYKCLIYDLGIVGFMLTIIFFILLTRIRKWDIEYLPFIVVFFASIYQRAYVFNVQMVTIFMIGIVFISLVKPQKYYKARGKGIDM